MRNWSIIAISSLLIGLAGCSLPPKDAQLATDTQLRRLLVGTWCTSDDGGKTCWGFDRYSSDGTSDSCGVLPETGKSFRIEATYRISGNIHDYVVTSSDSKTMPVGFTFQTETLAINAKTRRYKFTDSPEETTLYRVAAEAAVCLK
jgi:hypothetical protein